MNTIIELANIAENYNIRNSNRLRDDIVTECIDILESLDSIDKTVINKDISLVPIYKINEGYAIDLSSLKYVVESEKCTLEEAVQKIKDINYIGDTYPLYCILPEGFNESMTLDNFISLSESLNNAGIKVTWTNEISETEFLNEADLKTLFNNWNIKRLEKSLANYEKSLVQLQNKLDEFNKLSEQEQKKYCLNKTIKNLAVGTITGMIVPVVGTAAYITYIEMKGDNTILGPKAYKRNINIWINAYKTDIKRMKATLNKKKSKK